MRLRTLLFTIGGIILVAAIATPLVLVPGPPLAATAAPPPVPADEQAAIIAALQSDTRDRPLIAIMARNDGTEVSDFLSLYGVLKSSDVADVFVVAERDERIKLYPALAAADPDITIAAFDAAHPDGADYVVVPAMDPSNDPVIAGWLNAQRDKGAKIVSVCNGSRMLSTAGLLEGRRATGHWSAQNDLRKANPSMQWVADRRYVVDDGVATSTGITANMPAMLALVEAIGGRDAAMRVASDMAIASWDARHDSSAFVLMPEHMKTFVRNAVTFWRKETLGVPLDDGVDEVALGLLVDAYSRTQLARVVGVAATDRIVTKNGLTLYPDALNAGAKVSAMLPPPPDTGSGKLLDAVLPEIAARYDSQTADIVALAMEYPWAR